MKRIIAIIFVLVFTLCMCVAAFADGTVYVTVEPSAAAGTITPGLSEHYSDSGNHSYTASANPGYTFKGWRTETSFYPDSPNIDFTTDHDRYVAAVFEANTYSVRVSCDPAEGGNVSGGGSFHYGDSATISAVPNTGYDFDGWTGNVPPTPSTQSVTVNTDINAVAHFKGQEHTLSASVDPSGSGYVNALASFTTTETYSNGKVVSVKAQPVTGYLFDGWYEGGTKISSTADEIFDINRDRTIVARFILESSVKPDEPSTPSGGSGSGGAAPTPVDPGPAPVDPSLPGPPTPPGPYTEYTITYHPGAYGQGTPQAFTMAPGPGWLLGPTFTRPGYAQTGWSWYYDGKEKNADVFSVFAMPPRDIIVYPYWEPVKGPVTLSVGYSGSGAVQVNGRYVYNGEVFTLREGDSLTFGLYPSYGNYVYSVLLGNRYREVNTAYGYTITYDMLQGRNQTLLIRFESVYSRPKTGDDSNIALWAVLGACSVVCLGVLLVAKRKKK